MMVMRYVELRSRESVLIVGVDFGFGGDEGQSDKTRDDQIVVLDGGFGVFGFEWALIGHFREVYLADVESVWNVSVSGVLSHSVVHHVVKTSCQGVVLFQKHSHNYYI